MRKERLSFLHFLLCVWFQFLERLNAVYHGKEIHVEVSCTFTFLHGCWHLLILQLLVEFQTIWINHNYLGKILWWYCTVDRWTRHQKTILHFDSQLSCVEVKIQLMCINSPCYLSVFLLLSLSSCQFKSKSYLVILLKYTFSSSRGWFNF